MNPKMFDHLPEHEVALITARELTDWINACANDQYEQDRPLVYETPYSEHVLAFDCSQRFYSILIASSHLDIYMILEIATRLIDSQGFWYDDCDENRYTVTIGTSHDPDLALPIFKNHKKLADTMRLTRDFGPSRYLSIQIAEEE